MGSQAAQVMAERSGGASWKPAVVGGTALKGVPSLQEAPSPRQQLRAAVIERLQKDTVELLERMNEFLRFESRAGVATISHVFSVSSLAQELWKMPRQVPAARAHLAQALGLAAGGDEAALVRALLAEVRQAFADFERSAAGRAFRERYDSLLFTAEQSRVLVIVLGCDVGPMMGELARLGLRDEFQSGHSMLLDTRAVAVMPPTPEWGEDQVWVSGVSVSQLAAHVAQMRQINPLLSNRQACDLLVRALTDSDGTSRKSLGLAEMEWLLEGSRQLLRLQCLRMPCHVTRA